MRSKNLNCYSYRSLSVFKKLNELCIMRKLTFLSFMLLVVISFCGKASTGYLGGDISWRCIGQDSFIIKMVLYRDCNHDPMVSSVNLAITCKSSGSLISNVSFHKPAPVDITPTCGHSCTRCQSAGCSFPFGIEQYTFTKLVVFDHSVSCCKLLISYQACCRSSAFTNIQAGQFFYLEAMLNRCVSPCDNSPSFTNPPIALICLGQDFVFCHGIVDIDVNSKGELIDSLAYEWAAPLSASNSNVLFNHPYTFDKPLFFWGYPDANLAFPRGFHLDVYTGGLSFRPFKIEFASFALKIKEYRKGQLIGELMRDIGVLVISCPNNNAPFLSGPFYKEVVAGNAVDFSIHTNDYDPNDTLIISWNKSIPGAAWTDNNKQVKHPTGQLSWTPFLSDAREFPYVFTATVKDDACPINSSLTRAYQVLVRAYPVSVDESLEEKLIVYPNPASKELTIKLDRPTFVNSIQLYNALGEILWQEKESKLPYELDISQFNTGIYILQLEINNCKLHKRILIN